MKQQQNQPIMWLNSTFTVITSRRDVRWRDDVLRWIPSENKDNMMLSSHLPSLLIALFHVPTIETREDIFEQRKAYKMWTCLVECHFSLHVLWYEPFDSCIWWYKEHCFFKKPNADLPTIIAVSFVLSRSDSDDCGGLPAALSAGTITHNRTTYTQQLLLPGDASAC